MMFTVSKDDVYRVENLMLTVLKMMIFNMSLEEKKYVWRCGCFNPSKYEVSNIPKVPSP